MKPIRKEDANMKHQTNPFTCPTGRIVIVAHYNETTKRVTFDDAKGYYYPQDSQNSIDCANADQFMKDHAKTVGSLQEANEYLVSLGITEAFQVK